MLLVAFISLLAVCVIAGTFYSIFSSKAEPLNMAIKMFAPISCALLAVVTANLSSAIGGQSMFIILGLLFMIGVEGFSFIQNKEHLNNYLKNMFLALGFGCFFASSIIHGTFSVLPICFGLFCALGVWLVGFAINDKDRQSSFWISNAVMLAILGIFLGQGVANLLAGAHLIASILYLASSVLIMSSNAVLLFKKEKNSISRMVSSALNILGLIAIASSIYFL